MTNPDLVNLADTITGHVVALANEPLRMPLTTWNVVSNDILAAAESLRRLASSDGEPDPVAWPANLNPRTLDLVQRFALALAKKLRLAEEKYGHTDGWSRDDWEAECRDHLYQHLEKGDPRDVAAYCAFMWHHGWITYRAAKPVASKRPVAFRVRQHRLSNYYELYTDEKDAQFWADDRGVDYEGLYLVADRHLAQPADAGMREAFVRVLASLAAAISILERTPKAKKAVASDKMFDTMLDDYRKALEIGRSALTAPGATTKSDGGVEGHAEYRQGLPVSVGDKKASNAVDVASETDDAATGHPRAAGIKPVPAHSLREAWTAVPPMERDFSTQARGLLDQFEIRRK